MLKHALSAATLVIAGVAHAQSCFEAGRCLVPVDVSLGTTFGHGRVAPASGMIQGAFIGSFDSGAIQIGAVLATVYVNPGWTGDVGVRAGYRIVDLFDHAGSGVFVSGEVLGPGGGNWPVGASLGADVAGIRVSTWFVRDVTHNHTSLQLSVGMRVEALVFFLRHATHPGPPPKP